MKIENNIISDWLEQHGDPNIEIKVLNEVIDKLLQQVNELKEELAYEKKKYTTMTPKGTARDLVLSFYYALPNNGSLQGLNSTTSRYQEGIRCALIAVDHIINCNTFFKTIQDSKDFTHYWFKVQQEIQKLS